MKAVERLLGPGSVPWKVDPTIVRQDLPRRIEHVNEVVPPLRRAQVIRDLCVISRADGEVTEAETAILFEIADAVGVDRDLVTCTAKEAPEAHAPGRPIGGLAAAPEGGG